MFFFTKFHEQPHTGGYDTRQSAYVLSGCAESLSVKFDTDVCTKTCWMC